MMRQTVRLFLFIEAVCFIIAGVIHSGLLVSIDIHHQAAIAESVIGAVLLLGFALTWLWPGQTRVIGLVAQTFAALGTLVGISTIIIGIGPRTAPDIVFHLAILAVLAWGLVVPSAPTMYALFGRSLSRTRSSTPGEKHSLPRHTYRGFLVGKLHGASQHANYRIRSRNLFVILRQGSEGEIIREGKRVWRIRRTPGAKN